MMSDATGLLDTNIFVDILREYQPAIDWMTESTDLEFAVPSLVRMELILGTNNKAAQERIIRLIRPYPVIYPNEADARWAMEQFEVYHLSHRIGIADCFIAAMGARFNLPIYTRNVRDLGAFAGVTVIAPY